MAAALQTPTFDQESAEDLIRRADQMMRDMEFAGTGDEEFDQLVQGAWNAPPPEMAGPNYVEVPKTPRQEEAANPHGRQTLEELLRQAGPNGKRMKEILVDLSTGGPWGKPVEVSRQTVDTWIRQALPVEQGGTGLDATQFWARKLARGVYGHRDVVQGNQ